MDVLREECKEGRELGFDAKVSSRCGIHAK